MNEHWESAWQETRRNNAIIRNGMQSGASMERIAFALAKSNDELMRRVLHLESIAPRRIRLPSGKEYVWRCPDDLIPLADVNT